ncbi:MAG: hypothetical protein LC650_00955 [Actinobacteria bacterium]|nr:hypothetical protein [Actinomycetota bacterium]
MATKVNKSETITLQDGKEVELKPLNIKNLRDFMAVVKKFQDVDDEVEGLDIMIEACSVGLRKTAPEIAEDTDYLEENLDMNHIERILFVAGGVDISGDPNLQKAG